MRENATGEANADLGEWMATTFVETAKTGSVPIMPWYLEPVITKRSFTQYWTRVWSRRAFIWADARAKALQTTRGVLLGKLWLILSPFLNALIFYVIFGLILKVDRGIPNFLGYLVIGVLFFPIFQNALSSGSSALTSSSNMVRSFSFPAATVVVAWSLRAMLDFIPILVAALLFIMIAPPHVAPSALWLLIVPILFLGFLFGNGLALFTSSLTAGLKDLKFVWPLLGRFWFYVSGVFFSVDRFDNVFIVSFVMQANPAYVFLMMARDVLIYDTIPSRFTWSYMTVWAIGVWLIGAVVFWWREGGYAEELD